VIKERIVMILKERDLLRLHVEAVWGVALPSLVNDDCELLPTSGKPSWQVYVADIATARIYIWRPDVSASERESLRLRLNAALAYPPAFPGVSGIGHENTAQDVSPASTSFAGISREVAFSFVASPTIDLDSAHSIARPLTLQDQSLIEFFRSDSPSDLLYSAKRPIIGVVNSGRLLCVAHSSRRTDAACELGIDTLPSARRKGYALAATIVWTYAILQEGLIPIYSAFAENTPSLRLAVASGYRVFAYGATCEA
jgi:hypothetical protein